MQEVCGVIWGQVSPCQLVSPPLVLSHGVELVQCPHPHDLQDRDVTLSGDAPGQMV
jgi:hypothetical protein